MFNPFKKKADQKTEEITPVVDPNGVGQFLIITAATNFGLVVMPDTRKPLMFKMEPADTIATCVARNAPYVTSAVDVSTCLVLQLAAELPNHTHAANKIFALVLPDPGILINQDMVVVGYEEIGNVPGATNSMLQMLVKQVPQEYFADPTVEPGRVNSPSVSPNAQLLPQTPEVQEPSTAEAVVADEPPTTPQNPSQTN